MTEPRAEPQHTFGWALALSAGVHLLVMMTLDLAPGAWRHGLQPAFKVTLQPAPAPAGLEAGAPSPEAAPRPAAPAPRARGIDAESAQAGSSIPTPVRYYRNSEVDEPAVPIERGRLVIPEHAYLSRLAGTVKARIFVSEEGTVESVDIVEVRPVAGVFEEAALEALRQVRYTPARIAGRPVKTQKLIEVTFDPKPEAAAR